MGGHQNRSGGFAEDKNLFSLSGFEPPDIPPRSLVTVLTIPAPTTTRVYQKRKTPVNMHLQWLYLAKPRVGRRVMTRSSGPPG
jgi:hypothetical protein